MPAPPIPPMLAKVAEALPQEAGFLFEPKWDGFRALVFRGTGPTYLQSRDLRPLNRYFPELERALQEALPRSCVLDGEIVVATTQGLDFDALQMRLHLAASSGGPARPGDAGQLRRLRSAGRWRPDQPPKECRYDQLEVTTAYELQQVFGAKR